MRIYMRVLCIISCLFFNLIRADQITVYNKTDQDVYAAVYKQKNTWLGVSSAQRYTNAPMAIKAGNKIMLDRPGREIGYDRELAFTYDKERLTATLTVQEFNNIQHRNIGDKYVSKDFYIAQEKGKLESFNDAEWKVLEPAFRKLKEVKNKAIQVVTDPIQDYIKQNLPELKDYPHKRDVAQVRVGNSLHAGEKEYLAVRKPKAKSALEKLLGHSIEGVPTIALVESGGGYRAMTCSLGWHVGLAKIGLMDAITYMVGLSGSTWSIGLWVLSGLSIEQFKEQLIPLMGGLNAVSPEEFVLMANSWLVKTAFDQQLTLVDLYAGLLANALLKPFGTMRQRVYLSDQINKIKDGQLPFPIYTAVRAEDTAVQDWYEFTPYEIGASWLGVYVPAWAYGRKFDNGGSIDFAPEQSFGFQMGTFGSAFAAKIDQIYAEITQDDPLPVPFDTLVDAMIDRIGQERITRARVFNFAANMPEAKRLPHPLENQMQLVDAGVAINLPYPPISGERPERTADIIIFLDASGGQIGNDLKKVEAYARSKGLKFPVIDYTKIASSAVSIFKDGTDASMPLVIYLPRVMDLALFNALSSSSEYRDFNALLKGFDVDECLKSDYCNTNNFKYIEQQIRQLSGMTEFNIRGSADAIKRAIDWKIQQITGTRAHDENATSSTAQTQIQQPAGPIIGTDGGDGYIWNNPPRYQAKCDNGAQLKDENGQPCTFVSKHCACVCPAGKRLNPLNVEKKVPGVERAHWGCR